MILFFDEGNQIRVAEDLYHHDLLARVLFGLWVRDDIKQRPGFYSDGDVFEGDSALSFQELILVRRPPERLHGWHCSRLVCRLSSAAAESLEVRPATPDVRGPQPCKP